MQKKGKALSLDEIQKVFEKVNIKVDLGQETQEQKDLKVRWPMMGYGS